ncbi:MAG: hypothetical protein V3R29_02290, partial [Candidatus Acidoferrales bacterium]
MGNGVETAGSPKKRRRWLWVLVATAVVLMGLLVLVPLLLREWVESQRGEARPVSDLRTMNTALITYFSTYDNGYPSNLGMLGAPRTPPSSCERADMLDPSLVSADTVVEKWGYRYEYRPGPAVEEAGPDCTTPGVESYVLVARPIEYGRTGTNSFRTDETMLITFTREDRAA